MLYPDNLIKDPYAQRDLTGVKETDPAELTGSVINSQENTRNNWADWV